VGFRGGDGCKRAPRGELEAGNLDYLTGYKRKSNPRSQETDRRTPGGILGGNREREKQGESLPVMSLREREKSTGNNKSGCLYDDCNWGTEGGRQRRTPGARWGKSPDAHWFRAEN